MVASIPSSFGRYQIKSEIGRGGMAVVYYAIAPRFCDEGGAVQRITNSPAGQASRLTGLGGEG